MVLFLKVAILVNSDVIQPESGILSPPTLATPLISCIGCKNLKSLSDQICDGCYVDVNKGVKKNHSGFEKVNVEDSSESELFFKQLTECNTGSVPTAIMWEEPSHCQNHQ